MSNISFDFGAMEFQEKMLLRFTDLYISLGQNLQMMHLMNPSLEKTALRQTKKTHLGNTSVIIKVIHFKYYIKRSCSEKPFWADKKGLVSGRLACTIK